MVEETNDLSCLLVDCYLCSQRGHLAVDCQFFGDISGNLRLHGEQLKNKIRRMKSLIRKEAKTAAPTANNSPKLTVRMPTAEKVYETEEEHQFNKAQPLNEADGEFNSSESELTSSEEDLDESKEEEYNSASLE